MFPPTPYEALEERMRRLRNEQIDSRERLDKKFEAKRTALQAQKTNKFSTTAIEAAAQEKQLAEEQKTKTNNLRARHVDEVQQLRLRHARELAEREEEEELAKNALVEQNSAEKTKLEKIFEDESAAIETQLKLERLELEAANKAENEQVKNDMFEFMCSRVQAAKLEQAESRPGSPLRSHREHQQPVSKSETLAPKGNKDTGMPSTLSIRGTAEKRKHGNNSIPTGPKNGNVPPPRNIPVEGTPSKRVRLTSSAINSDPTKFFQVICFRHYKHGEHKSTGPTDLWESPEKKLYLHMGLEFLRPVAIRDGNSDTVKAAYWYLELFDINQVQYYGPHCLVRFQMKSFSIRIRFKHKDILNGFLVALQQWAAMVPIHATTSPPGVAFWWIIPYEVGVEALQSVHYA
ncbi:hypothetical protein DL98DRAFT_565021 [Cadophora sp. DSE1049]|nr:hypothetical protein DL98DRAFT_565021 [Cadophora sp. DSE1049]